MVVLKAIEVVELVVEAADAIPAAALEVPSFTEVGRFLAEVEVVPVVVVVMLVLVIAAAEVVVVVVVVVAAAVAAPTSAEAAPTSAAPAPARAVAAAVALLFHGCLLSHCPSNMKGVSQGQDLTKLSYMLAHLKVVLESDIFITLPSRYEQQRDQLCRSSCSSSSSGSNSSCSSSSSGSNK